jgi:CRP/FNR family cyclic AMP-dependent transcriptional regulator
MTITDSDPLSGIPALSSLSLDTRRRLARNCRSRSYRAGEKVAERGQEANQVYFVTAGHLRVLNFSATGRMVRYAALAPGDYFGELAAIDGQPRSATVVAETDCELVILPGEDFRALITSEPDFAVALINRLAGIVRACDDRIMDLSSLGPAQRVCLELLRLAQPDPLRTESWVVYPVPTKASLASMIGTTRETVARVISRLSSDGIVSRKSKSLYIRDRTRLESLALL